MSIPSLNINQNGINQVTADQLNTYITGGAVVSSLRAFTGISNMTAYILGFNTPNDGGAGTFYWNANGTAADDNGVTTIVPNASSNGCWTRIGSGSVNSIVNSVANSDSTLTITPTTGSVVASLNLSHANTWTGTQIIPLGSGTTSVTQSAGDNSTDVATDNFVNLEVAPLGQCQFAVSSTTACILNQFNGNKVIFPSGAVAIIPLAGITTTQGSLYLNGTVNSTLSNSTFYYAYLAIVSGSPVIDWSTTGRATDSTTGIQIKSGDNTRVLVGSAYVTSSGTFVDSAVNRYVRSWYNRGNKYLQTSFTTNRTTTSTSLTEINSEIRAGFCLWSDEFIELIANGTFSNATANDGTAVAIGINSTTVSVTGSAVQGDSTATSSYLPFSFSYAGTVSEGVVNYATLLGAVNASTGTWGGSFVQSYSTITGLIKGQ